MSRPRLTEDQQRLMDWLVEQTSALPAPPPPPSDAPWTPPPLRTRDPSPLAEPPQPPTPRNRRSRVDWEALLGDPAVAKAQVAWERRETAFVLRDTGMTLRQIGEKLGGLSPERVRQLILHAARTHQRGSRSPAERYLDERLMFAMEAPDSRRAQRLQRTLDIFAVGSPQRDWLLVGGRNIRTSPNLPEPR